MQSGNNKTRLYLFDNLKVLLITLVVFGHVINSIYTYNHVDKPQFIELIWILIYSFHMPLFVFISGFFSKRYSVYSYKTMNILTALIIPYFVFNLLYYLMNERFTIPILPDSAMWYLYALIIYRIFLPLFVRIKWILPISFLISCLMNFINVQIDEGTKTTLKYLPLFLLGFFLQESHIIQLREFGRRKLTVIFLCAIMVIFLAINFLGIGVNETNLYVHSEKASLRVFLGRCLSICFGCIIGIWLVGVFPNTKTFYTHIGKATMVIYLLHYLPWERIIYQKIIPINCEIVTLCLAVLLSLSIVFALSRDIIVQIYNKTLEFVCKVIVNENKLYNNNE